MRLETREALINEFARRSFRDVADGDYIAARMAFRAGLFLQALWASQQALEKYIKAILLFRRIGWQEPQHSLSKPLRRLEEKHPLTLSADVRRFIEFIDEWEADRYFTYSYWVEGLELIQLDRAVWEIRRYCIPYNLGKSPKGTPLEVLDLRYIEDAINHSPQRFRSRSPGFLDDVLRDRRHDARPALVWKNLYFGASLRTSLSNFKQTFFGANSVLASHPELLDIISPYIRLPKSAIRPKAL